MCVLGLLECFAGKSLIGLVCNVTSGINASAYFFSLLLQLLTGRDGG
ncbi:Uncharacterised protein [Vibrio cholerae]|nr:Uncharacterised protein [Vibrio cholerae]